MRMHRYVWIGLVAGCGANAAPEAPAITQTKATAVAPQVTIDLTRQKPISALDFMVTRARVWQALMRAHVTLDVPAIALDEAAGTATFLLKDQTGGIAGKPASIYIDCGQGSAGPRANSYRLTIRISERVEALAEEHTRVHTLVEAWARSPGVSSDAIECTSLGSLERHIVGLISAYLQP